MEYIQIHDTLTPLGAAPMTVIWRDWSTSALVTVDSGDPKSWPEFQDWNDVKADLDSGMMIHAEGKPPTYPAEHMLNDKHREKRDAAWAVIGPLVRNPEIFGAAARGRLIAEAAEAAGITARTIRNQLLAVFHGGMDPNALTPGWSRSGNKGVHRCAPEGAVKRGRPVAEGKSPGVNVTTEIRQMFLVWASRHERNTRVDLQQAYEDCMRNCFFEVVQDLDRSYPRHIPLSAYEKAGLPRYEQFCYWVNKDTNAADRMRKKIGERLWKLRHRGVIGSSTFEAWGPGARYQIDATVIDTYLRSKRKLRRILGRATLYIVIDVFSRMIVGFYLSLSPPSYMNAMMAIASCVEDKVELCRRYGITIQPEDWPSRALPAILEGDRGEMEGVRVVPIIEALGITVENAAAYRADWKGIVESRFRLVQAAFKPFVPGYVEKNFRERGARDYRLDAKLTLEDLIKVVIHQILAHNNYNQISDYPMHPGMVEDGVPAVPREMWNWGIESLGGLPRQRHEAEVRFALMHRREATVRANGIYHQGALYTCEKAIKEGWFEKARKKRFKVWISFDDGDADHIYVHDKDSKHGFQVACLTHGSQHRKGMSFWELHDMLLEEAIIADGHRTTEILGRADHDAASNQIVNDAVSAMEGIALGSAASQVAGIRDATSGERVLDRVDELADFHEPVLRAAGVLEDASAPPPSERDLPDATPAGDHRIHSAGSDQHHGSTPQQDEPGVSPMQARRNRNRLKELNNA